MSKTKINLGQIDGLIDPANPPVDPATDAGKIVILDDDGQIPEGTLETFATSQAAKRANGIATISSKTTTTITPGFRAGVVRIKAVLDNGDFDVEISNGVFSGGAQNCNKTQAAGVSNVADYIGNVYNSGNSVNLYLLVNNVTDTTFDIVSSSTGTWQPVLILWEAEV